MVMLTWVLHAVWRAIAGLIRLIILKFCNQHHHYGYGGLLYIQVSYKCYYLCLGGWWCRFDSCSPQLHCFISDGVCSTGGFPRWIIVQVYIVLHSAIADTVLFFFLMKLRYWKKLLPEWVVACFGACDLPELRCRLTTHSGSGHTYNNRCSTLTWWMR